MTANPNSRTDSTPDVLHNTSLIAKPSPIPPILPGALAGEKDITLRACEATLAPYHRGQDPVAPFNYLAEEALHRSF